MVPEMNYRTIILDKSRYGSNLDNIRAIVDMPRRHNRTTRIGYLSGQYWSMVRRF